MAREYTLDAAVWAGRHSAVLGLLVLALVPLGAMLVTVAMLLVMRPSTVPPGRRVRTVFAVLGSLIVPFLVVYEHYGTFAEDQRQYYNQAAHDAAELAAATGEVTDRVPAGASAAVLGTALGALALRSVAGRLSRGRPRTSGRRTVLQVLAGYCDVVWIVLGVFVVTLATREGREWWSGRVVTDRLERWWTELTDRFELLDRLAAGLVPTTDLLVAGVFTGLVVPISWLAFGTIVYGTQPAEAVAPVAGRVSVRLSARVGEQNLARAWRAGLDGERRFGPLAAGLAMIWRSGWSSALLFCLAYVVVGLSGQLVWGVARLAVGPAPVLDWTALAGPLDAVATMLVQVLSAALLAAAADALVRQLPAAPEPEGAPVTAPAAPSTPAAAPAH
ncbi:hypothetical protein [Jiangella alkaliphila]|uniref:Uncharacterized protein n=1 Tax=Jiangella alkaliphila TaxID=419479 RepID=A0A1H2KTA6_9ACTN|nr:hypothetical protein [Jiangella alkaliphila]SDU71852.1 hypothetical protein SAMN04488563_4252 [Jiangella alkaliphila]